MFIVPLPDRALFAVRLLANCMPIMHCCQTSLGCLLTALSMNLLQIPTSSGADPRFEYPKLVAVPLFDLYDNPGRYGPVLASLPALLSR